MLSKAPCFLAITIFCATSVFGVKDIQSRFTDPAKLRRFHDISKKLVCQCGCGMVLRSCNHTTCSAWSLRAAIEGLIEDGKTNEEIVRGFEKGFGQMALTHAAFSEARKISGFQNKLQNGFGQKVLSNPEDSKLPLLLYSSAGLLIIGFGAFFRLKFRKLEPKSVAPENVSTSDREYSDLLNRLYDDED